MTDLFESAKTSPKTEDSQEDFVAKSAYMPLNKAYKDAVRKGMQIYADPKATVYVWTLDGRRYATGSRPTDPKAKILAEIKR